MKKVLLLTLLFVVCTYSVVFAEASFSQIEGLIKEHNYSAAAQGLEIIIQNHPKSAKAFYAMSQAQAGLGNQIKAKEALDIATGIDPSLKFASSSNVKSLKQAVQPQTNKIEAIESHAFRNCMIFIVLFGVGCFFRRKDKGEECVVKSPEPSLPPSCTTQQEAAEYFKRKTQQDSNRAASTAIASMITPHRVMPPSYTPSYTANRYPHIGDASPGPVYATQPRTPIQHTVINNNSGTDGLITGMIVGSMLNNSHHDHVIEREVVVEREVERTVERETPVPSKSSSWDEPAKEAKSSSWEDNSSSSSSSSSWDSSSSSSSSWDSSSDSGSSSSWD